MRLVLVGLAVLALAACDGKPITKGDIKDRQAALDVEVCARGYIERGTSGMTAPQAWELCAEAAAELAKRPIEGVKAQVTRRQGRDVFSY